MKQFYVLSLIFGLLFGGSETTFAQTPLLPDLYISEVNWAGSSLSLADEWLEITNRTSQNVDIGGWILDGSASGGGAIQIATGTIIESNSTLLVANYDVGNEKTTLITKPQLVTSAISLANSNLTLRLIKSDGTVLDTLAFGSSPSAGSTNPFASAIRQEDGSVVTAQTSHGLQNTEQLGTPGIIDIAWFSTSPIIAQTENIVETVNDIPQDETVPIEETPVIIENQIEESVLPVSIVEIPQQETMCCNCACESTTSPTIENILSTPVSVAPSASIEVTNDTALPSQTETIVVQDETPIVTLNETVNAVIDYTAQQFIQLSEFVSDPLDGIEWIELYNPTDQSIDMTHMYLEDAGGGKTELSTQIDPHTYTVIEQPKGKLNNSGDSILLYTGDSDKIDEIVYGTDTLGIPIKGESGGSVNGNWNILETPTKGKQNIPNPATPIENTSSADNEEVIDDSETSVIIENMESTEEDQDSTNEITMSHEESSVVTIVSLAEKPETTKETENKSTSKKTTSKKSENKEVTITTTITVPPGILGKQIAYGEGYQLYLNKSDWPTLEAGNVVQVVGTVVEQNNEQRLKIKSGDAITVLQSGSVEHLATSDITFDAQHTGLLVDFQGTIIKREKRVLTLESAGITFSVHLPKDVNGILLAQDTLSGSGIIRGNKQGFFLEAISKDSLAIDAATDGDMTPVQKKSGHTSSKSVAGAGLVTGTLGALGFWLRKYLTLS